MVREAAKAVPKKQHVDSVIATRIFERIQIDATEIATDKLSELRGKHGYRYLLTIVDCLSKMAFAYPLKTLTVGEAVPHLRFLFDTYMVPEILQSDNGRQFRNKVLSALKLEKGYTHMFGAPYTPEHQGQIERFNRTFKVQLFRWIRSNKEHMSDWYLRVPAELACYNTTVHSSTQFPPEVLFFGRMRSPLAQKELEAQNKSMLRFLDDSSGRFTRTVPSSTRVAEIQSLSGQIARWIESRHAIQRLAVNEIAKRHAYNRLYLQGQRVKSSNLLRVGLQVYIPRPNKSNHLQSNKLAGRIIDQSLLSQRFKVRVRDGDEEYDTWEHASRIIPDNADDLTFTVPKTFTWTELRNLIPEFVGHYRSVWQNVQSLIQLHKWIPGEEKTVEGLLEKLELPNPKSVSTDQYGEALLFHLLDSLFLRFAGVEFHETPGIFILSEENIDLLLSHLVNLGFTLFLGTLTIWHTQRLRHPDTLYAMFLSSTMPRAHSCQNCFISAQCCAEHICCKNFVLQRSEEIGWLHKSNKGNYYRTDDSISSQASAPCSSTDAFIVEHVGCLFSFFSLLVYVVIIHTIRYLSFSLGPEQPATKGP